MPSFSFAHRVNEKAHTLVVRRIEPEHAGKNIVGLFDAAEPPQAETVAMQTPEEGTVVGVPPEKDAVEVFPEGELTDPHPDFVMADGRLGIAGEGEHAEVRMGIETAEISNEEAHEGEARLSVRTGLFEFDRLEYGIRIGIVRVLTGDDLFHLIQQVVDRA